LECSVLVLCETVRSLYSRHIIFGKGKVDLEGGS
jgi:hypothetical protein